MASFSVVALMKEDPEIVRRFAAHYVRIGAERVFIYYDGEIPPEVAALPDVALPGVVLTACDDAFWADRPAPRPVAIQERQEVIYTMTYAALESDWLFVCDADEFVIDRMPVGAFLDRVPEEVQGVVLVPAEAVWGPDEDIEEAFGSTWFRRPDFGPSGKGWAELRAGFRLYGLAGIMSRKGILSHVQGKQFVRAGQPFEMIGLHRAVLGGRNIGTWARDISPELGQVELAHYDAISFERWYMKWERRFRNDNRAAKMRRSRRRRLQYNLIRSAMAFGRAGARRIYRRMYQLSPRQMRLLEKNGQLFQTRIFGPEQSPGQTGEGQSSRSRA